jgi:hypothetical protein
MSEPSTIDTPPLRRSWLMALPLVAFTALAACSGFGWEREIRRKFPPP